MSTTPRVRMFAGPNGSGKSTFNSKVPAHLLVNYINPDAIELGIRETGVFDFAVFGLYRYAERAIAFLRSHSLLSKFPDSLAKLDDLVAKGERIIFASRDIDSYIASALSDFIRVSLIDERVSFTFETVMSDGSKIELLRQAKAAGYRVYVYYVATADADINVARVAYRASTGGHDVPPDKIRSRYKRSLENLSEAILLSNRAYIFDNSQDGEPSFAQLAEITEGEDIDIVADTQPAWFQQYVIDKLT
ncbi:MULTISPECIES: zeta toxin family protein [Pseudomonas]|uniref:zeta toxin family protein n=1 Tax=Pseudomonas TaxID=286 RepID=UPI00215B6E77|nr:zeta toxin family protein [Pseudomonas sp. FP597]WLI04424.1 zeta toxin family protein [Pseudomonas sp. FP597]